jgi:hypothetical protein
MLNKKQNFFIIYFLQNVFILNSKIYNSLIINKIFNVINMFWFNKENYIYQILLILSIKEFYNFRRIEIE